MNGEELPEESGGSMLSQNRADGTCEHVFDPEDLPIGEYHLSFVAPRWECPHDVVPGESKCIFHLDIEQKSDDAVRDAFLDVVQNGSPAERELIDAKFGKLDLGQELLESDDSQPIDLRHATFSGPLILIDTQIIQTVRFACCTFADLVNMRHSTFAQNCFFDDARFSGDVVNFMDTSFQGELYCRKTRFECSEVFFNRATFGGNVNFSRAVLPRVVFRGGSFARQARFTGTTLTTADFTRVRVDQHLHAFSLTVTNTADFTSLQVGSADFRLAECEEVTFADAVFHGQAEFFESEFTEATFSNTQFQTRCDFGRAEFEECDFTEAHLGQVAKFDGVHCTQKAQFQRAEFGRAHFSGARFNRSADFSYADFQFVYFVDVPFGGTATFKGATAHFINFTAAVFGQDAEFKHVSFDWVNFRGVVFYGVANFRDATLGVADFSSGALDDDLNVRRPVEYEVHPETVADLIDNPSERMGVTTRTGATFEDTAIFGFAEFTDRAIFTDAQFLDYARFFLTEFNRALFHRTCFEDVAYFARTTFHDIAVFDEAEFADGQFHHSTFTNLTSFRDAETVDETYPIDLYETEIAELEISQPPDGTGYYDFARATLGETTFYSDSGNGEYNPFDFCRIYETTFEHFDFTEYHDMLRSDWELHHFEGPSTPARDEAREIDPGLQEVTYLKAKNGAHAIGDDTAAAEFFKHQMQHRKIRHTRAAENTDSTRNRITHRLRRVGNDLLRITSGYGEAPVQVVTVSSLVLILFAVLFAGLFELVVLPGGGSPPTYQWVGTEATEWYGFEYLVFSIQSFVAFLLEGGPGTGNIVVQFLASLEAFLGAFLIALFVFTLTRSLNR